MFSTKSDLLAAVAGIPRVKSINVPLLGELYVKHLTESQVGQLYDTKNEDHRRAMFATLALCDEQGTRLFDDADFEAVKEWPLPVKMRIWVDGGRFNGFIIDDEEESKN